MFWLPNANYVRISIKNLKGISVLPPFSNKIREIHHFIYLVSMRMSPFILDESQSQFYQLESYIEELNSTPGFIKELCYNNDGRLIFSPFGYGVRMLSANTTENSPKKPSKLQEQKLICSHKNTVLTTRCAPYFSMLASGCLDGQVVFYQPKL